MILIALLILQIIAGYNLTSAPRSAVFDLYHQLKPRAIEIPAPVAIIEIDDKSMEQFGQWPWPRTQTAKLLAEISALGASAIGFDVLMSEPDRMSLNSIVEQYPWLDTDLRRSIEQLPSNDELFATAIGGLPIVLGRVGTDQTLSSRIAWPVPSPILINEPPVLNQVHNFADQISNIPLIEQAAQGIGISNTRSDSDGIVRKLPLVMTVGEHLEVVPSFALELVRVAKGAELIKVIGQHGIVKGIQLDELLMIPTDADASITLYFSPAESIQRYSATKILSGLNAPNELVNKIVLIGVTAFGLADEPPTPVAPRMGGTIIQAQAIENILSGLHLRQPTYAIWVEVAALLLVGLMLIIAMPKLRPSLGFIPLFVMVAVLVGASYLAFATERLLFDPIYPTLGSVSIFLVMLIAVWVTADRKRRELKLELDKERLEYARMAGELDAAHKIQLATLPDPSTIEGLPGTLSIYALLEPAREVGGDLYDVFMLDEHRLFFLIGDVAGKGVPASLFMVLSKALCKSSAWRSGHSISKLIDTANFEISRENPSSLFVTAVAGILDARTGTVEFCNAGHAAPFLLQPGQMPEKMRSEGGPPLCAIDDFRYPVATRQLQSGDIVILMTDGVSEAMGENEMYGGARVMAFLSTVAPNADLREIVDGLYADVKRFGTKTELADDITILAIKYQESSGNVATCR